VSDVISAIFQQYHGENKLIFNEMMKQQSPDRHVAPLGQISQIPSQPVCSFS